MAFNRDFVGNGHKPRAKLGGQKRPSGLSLIAQVDLVLASPGCLRIRSGIWRKGKRALIFNRSDVSAPSGTQLVASPADFSDSPLLCPLLGNTDVQAEYAAPLAIGKILVGLGFYNMSHLRSWFCEGRRAYSRYRAVSLLAAEFDWT